MDLIPARHDGYLLAVVTRDDQVNQTIESNFKNHHISYHVQSSLHQDHLISTIYTIMVKPSVVNTIHQCLNDIDGLMSYNLLVDDGNHNV